MNLQRVLKNSSMLPSTTSLFRVTAPALRFMSSVRSWEALRGLESLMRQSLVFFFSCCHLCLCLCLSSPHLTSWHQSLVLSLLLKLWVTPHSGGEAPQWLTHYCWWTEGARIYISQPEAETGLGGDGKSRMGRNIMHSPAAMVERRLVD